MNEIELNQLKVNASQLGAWRLINWVYRGIYYGYPSCCIKAFILESHQERQSEQRQLKSLGEDIGCMLCPECQKLSTAEYVSGVNSRRMALSIFSATKPVEKDDGSHYRTAHRWYEFEYGENLCEMYRPLKELENELYEQVSRNAFPYITVEEDLVPYVIAEEDHAYLRRAIRSLEFQIIEVGVLNTPDHVYQTRVSERVDKSRLYRINTQNLSLVVLCEKEYTEEEMKHLLHFHKLPIRKLFE
jgi:hypothetical protein